MMTFWMCTIWNVIVKTVHVKNVNVVLQLQYTIGLIAVFILVVLILYSKLQYLINYLKIILHINIHFLSQGAWWARVHGSSPKHGERQCLLQWRHLLY